jgi:glycosyltransferase involved in cell wall biosynthesis
MQQHSEDLARGLLAEGHRVTLLTATVPPGRDLRDLPRLADVDWAVAEAGIPRDDPKWPAASLRAFEQLIAREPFDVVHSQSGGGRGLIDAGVPRRVPTVMAYHGNFYGFVKSQMRAGWSSPNKPHGIARGIKRSIDNARFHYGMGHHRAYRGLESIVVSPNQFKDTVRSQRLDPAHTHIVMNGVDATNFRPGREPELRSEWGVPQDAVLLMTLGRLAADKGTDRALRAMTFLPEEVRLAVVGGGEEEEALHRLAAELGIEDRVVFTGAMDQTGVPRALRAADIFLFPTVRDEAAGLVLTQAMATGIPVIASRIGGIPDYVAREGEQAVLVPPGDVPALVAATRRLIDDPARRAAMGVAAREHCLREFSLEVMAAKSVDVYRRAIARLEQAQAQASARAAR